LTLRGLFALVEPFVVALLGTVLIATLLPPRGAGVAIFDTLKFCGILLLFFLQGAKLSRAAIAAGFQNWKVHVGALSATYLLFPLLGLAVASLPLANQPLLAGLLFLTLLPSTVQSSIAFTAIARGDVAAAVCSASFSNLLGIFLTPILVSTLMDAGQGATSFGAVQTIVLQLLLPFAAGHLARPWIGDFVARHKAVLFLVDRGSILLVVYTAFGAAVVQGLLQSLSVADLAITAALCVAMLVVMLGATWWGGRLAGLTREDRIVLLFCGSKKSLASGVPMAGVLFPAAQVGVMVVPLMIFHQIQLIACAFIARHYEAEAQARDLLQPEAPSTAS